jgi:predicted RNA-binding protein associated with RNAse of E/G family
MNPILDNVFISLAIMLSVTFAIITVIAKSTLEKNGYKVTYMNPSLSDYINLKKLSKEKGNLKSLYLGLQFSTIGSVLTFILFLITVLLA